MEKKGIICFETGQFASHRTDDEFYAKPLLDFIKDAWDVDVIYRQIATLQELEFYLKQIGKESFLKKYGIIYLSFHGSKGAINLKGTGNVTLDYLMETVAHYNSFYDRHVHFSSCETLKIDEADIKDFKRNTGAASVSGYTKVVDSVSAYINELAYFDQIMRFKSLSTIKEHMSNYQNQLDKLGFTLF